MSQSGSLKGLRLSDLILTKKKGMIYRILNE